MQGTKDVFGVRGNCHSLARYLRERQLSRSKHDRLFLFNQLAGCSILLHYFYPLFNCSCGERPSCSTITEAALRILHVEYVCYLHSYDALMVSMLHVRQQLTLCKVYRLRRLLRSYLGTRHNSLLRQPRLRPPFHNRSNSERAE